jgi:hypothetical protein
VARHYLGEDFKSIHQAISVFAVIFMVDSAYALVSSTIQPLQCSVGLTGDHPNGLMPYAITKLLASIRNVLIVLDLSITLINIMGLKVTRAQEMTDDLVFLKLVD